MEILLSSTANMDIFFEGNLDEKECEIFPQTGYFPKWRLSVLVQIKR